MNKKQLEIMNSKKPYKVWIGGRNTGRTNNELIKVVERLNTKQAELKELTRLINFLKRN